MKIAPILHLIQKEYSSEIDVKLLHTGQHYDYEMSRIFFEELGITEPDFHLGVGSGSHAEQTGKVFIEFEKVLKKECPDWVIVVGDVNPTMACTIVANKLGIKVAHVEAGLRSYDRSMPEEINRVITDSIADLLLTPSIDANMNLVKEGIPEKKIRFVGNIMIDTLYNFVNQSNDSPILSMLDLQKNNYILVTLHRPSNVDQKNNISGYVDVLEKTALKIPVVWPIHPRSKKRTKDFGLLEKLHSIENIHIIDPVGYVDNVCLMANAKLVLTDSGGIQEETTALGIPCLTARNNTERPITIEEGTNMLVGTDPDFIVKQIDNLLNSDSVDKNSQPKPLYWDGNSAKRIVDSIIEFSSFYNGNENGS